LVRIRLSGVGSRTSICTTSNNSGSTCFLVLYQQINYVSILEKQRINTISSVIGVTAMWIIGKAAFPQKKASRPWVSEIIPTVRIAAWVMGIIDLKFSPYNQCENGRLIDHLQELWTLTIRVQIQISEASLELKFTRRLNITYSVPRDPSNKDAILAIRFVECLFEASNRWYLQRRLRPWDGLELWVFVKGVRLVKVIEEHHWYQALWTSAIPTS
jgi:hypothetical protein